MLAERMAISAFWRKKVLLPEPELPIIEITSPSWAVTETPFSTSSAPKRLWIFAAIKAGMVVSDNPCPLHGWLASTSPQC